jgi:uncharacterized protein (TIGR03032 family)
MIHDTQKLFLERMQEMSDAEVKVEQLAADKPADKSTGDVLNSEVEPEYTFSSGLNARLAALNVSVAFTSYQSGVVYLIGRDPNGGLHLHKVGLAKPMGISADGQGRLMLASGAAIVQFENVLEPHERVNHVFDACYMPRRIHVTGELDVHDVGLAGDGNPIFVNTRFNCLAKTSPRHSFELLWKPSFISGLLDGDKCHLNGMTMAEGKPAYVTAVSRSDVIDGWRDRRANGGIVIDVERNEIICEGLSMPHSPRLHNGELWVLNSGSGELGIVTRPQKGKGKFEPRAFCPGFLRGLAFQGKYAFVGLSKPRYKRFEGLALDQRLAKVDAEPWCGVQIIDIETGGCVDWMRIDGAVAELYDVAVLPDIACPMAVAPYTADAASLITHAGSASLIKPISGASEEVGPNRS